MQGIQPQLFSVSRLIKGKLIVGVAVFPAEFLYLVIEAGNLYNAFVIFKLRNYPRKDIRRIFNRPSVYSRMQITVWSHNLDLHVSEPAQSIGNRGRIPGKHG